MHASVDSFRALNPAINSAFSRTDMLVTMAVIIVLVTIIINSLKFAHDQRTLKVCSHNLHQVGRAVLMYAEEHGGRLPGPVPGQSGDFWWWYKEQVKSYAGITGSSSINDRLFACPMDRGYSDPNPFYANSRFDYSSYVFNGVIMPGAPNIAVNDEPSAAAGFAAAGAGGGAISGTALRFPSAD